jgi:hypothetical protein
MEIDYSQEMLNHMTPFGFEIKITDIIIILGTVAVVLSVILFSVIKCITGRFTAKKPETITIKSIQEIGNII